MVAEKLRMTMIYLGCETIHYTDPFLRHGHGAAWRAL